MTIGYLCSDYEGEKTPDSIQGIEARFFKFNELPEGIDSFIKNKLVELKGRF
jgi:hypothetical protein